MVLNLPEGEDLGVALGPACWDEPRVRARAIRCLSLSAVGKVQQGHILKFAKLLYGVSHRALQ
jgi:hypothetical protein